MSQSLRIPATFDVADLTHPDEKKDAELRALAKGGDMTPLEILKQARELISVPERWTKGAFAYDAQDNDLGRGNATGAVCWCALGAIEHVVDGPCRGHAEDMLEDQMGEPVDLYNDRHTHAEVIAAFDRAIAAAEGGR